MSEVNKKSSVDKLNKIMGQDYKHGFQSDIASEKTVRGLSVATIKHISAQKKEPQFLLDYRLKAYTHWQTMQEPVWADLKYPKINYDNIIYYAAPKINHDAPKSLDDIDPELKRTFEKLGIPLMEQKKLSGVAVDAIFDSVSVATTYKAKLLEQGVVFCSFSEAVKDYPDLIKKYMGSVVPYTDNYFATLNSAVFTDGSFVYIPKGVKCPMDLSSYFRINTEESGQFERTLIIAEEGSSVNYLEGCTAPKFDSNQLHAAVVELVALDNAEIKYSTVQNWYAGDPETGRGGIFNFVTKRGKCEGIKSKISWTQVETGSSITWKYPSCILKGEGSIGEFYSVALTNHHQQADTGTKMIHIGKNTKSRIISKGISAGKSTNSYRGLVSIQKNATGSRNFTQCDSLLIGTGCKANTFPATEVKNNQSKLEHEASTSKVSDDQLFYFQQRGITAEEAMAAIINGFCQSVFKELPQEFAVEATQLLGLKLEGTVG